MIENIRKSLRQYTGRDLEPDTTRENWYAVFVRTGEEEKVKERLNYRFNDRLRILVPKRKIKERKNGAWTYVIKTLFPGYVLVYGKIAIEEYYQFKNVPGLLKLLRSGYEPLIIDPYEMAIINKLICNSDTVGFSNILMENGKIVVADGPLVSLEGRIISINHRKGRAKVSLDFMGEQRTVELGVSVLQSAEET